jgi:hypothetical protein
VVRIDLEEVEVRHTDRAEDHGFLPEEGTGLEVVRIDPAGGIGLEVVGRILVVVGHGLGEVVGSRDSSEAGVVLEGDSLDLEEVDLR